METAYQLLLKVAFYGGLVTLLLAPLFSKRNLRRLGKIHFECGFNPFAPNWITTYSTLITVAGFLVYVWSDPIVGVFIAIFGSALDRIDGKMANAMNMSLSNPKDWIKKGQLFVAKVTNCGSETTLGIRTEHKYWYEFNFAGRTDLGKILDPLGDKLKAITFLVYFGFWAHILNPWLVIAIILPEVFGTLIRRPFHLFKDRLQQTVSTSVGKYKALLQWITAILCLPYDLERKGIEFWEGLDWLPNVFLGLSAALAIASVISRFKFIRRNRSVEQVLVALDTTVQHD